jgi:hypothetical protein
VQSSTAGWHRALTVGIFIEAFCSNDIWDMYYYYYYYYYYYLAFGLLSLHGNKLIELNWIIIIMCVMVCVLGLMYVWVLYYLMLVSVKRLLLCYLLNGHVGKKAGKTVTYCTSIHRSCQRYQIINVPHAIWCYDTILLIYKRYFISFSRPFWHSAILTDYKADFTYIVI